MILTAQTYARNSDNSDLNSLDLTQCLTSYSKAIAENGILKINSTSLAHKTLEDIDLWGNGKLLTLNITSQPSKLSNICDNEN